MFHTRILKKIFFPAVILIVSISCNLPIGELARQEIREGQLMITPEVINAQIDEINEEVASNFIGTRRYSLTPPKGAVNNKECNTGHLAGPEATTINTLNRSKDPQDIESNTVTIEENGVTYIYKQVIPDKPKFSAVRQKIIWQNVSL